uniref:TOM1-like protein 2 n=2 Tax=Vitis vinifera TaxID=29760 RepID=F6HZK7_VITVI
MKLKTQTRIDGAAEQATRCTYLTIGHIRLQRGPIQSSHLHFSTQNNQTQDLFRLGFLFSNSPPQEKMDKLKLASLGERLKTGGAQMGRMVSGKVKEILQTPTQESKMVDEATSESLSDPNWGMNLRICAMINSEEFSGAEIVRAIKKKISSKNVVSQRLSLDLLEVCSMNCEKVFSEVASEKLLDDMVRMIDNPQTDHTNKERALQLIQAWGESEDLAYLPVFRQTYMSVKRSGTPPPVQDGSSPPIPYSLESYVHQQPLSPPGSYPIPDAGLHRADSTAFSYNYGILSMKEKKEFLLITRNSLELLSSILDSQTEPKPIKDDLTVSMVEKCKQSQPVVQRIVESTINDEGMLFEALYLHDELQQVISKYEEMEAKSTAQLPENPNTAGGNSAEPVELNEAKTAESPKGESGEASNEASNDQKSI